MMEFHPLFSIIVPVYNAELFVAKCIESILNQSYRDFELIVCNDGSKDNSLTILEDFEKKDHRIKVFSQSNKGVSTARNLGIEKVKGKHILFIDADDWVESSYLGDFVSLLDKHGDQLIWQNVNCVYQEGKNPHAWAKGQNINKLPDNYLYDYKEGKYNQDTLFDTIDIFNAPHPFAKLFNTDLIKKKRILFDIDLEMGEDLIFLITYLSYWKGDICISNNVGYQYNCMNESSAMSSKLTPNNNIKLIDTLIKMESQLSLSKPLIKVCKENVRKKLQDLYSLISTTPHFPKYGFIKAHFIENQELRTYFLDMVGKTKGNVLVSLLKMGMSKSLDKYFSKN